MGSKHKSKTALSVSAQYISMAAWKTHAESSSFKCGKLIWTGFLQPTEISHKYKIRLEYTEHTKPSVYIISPQLQQRDGINPPHLYSFERQHLCLYYWKDGDWNKSMKIAETIIPWAIEWLLFYELWLITGEWQGGGVHCGVKT